MSHPNLTKSDVAAPARPAVSPAEALAADLRERFSQLYRIAQRSDYVFASPLGPFSHAGGQFHLPRFVYFGPHTSDESLRLAFHSGFNGSDLLGSLSLLHFIERLALQPQLGQGLNLSFLPLVDVLGVFTSGVKRDLARDHWGFTREPEIKLLEQDARHRGYHGFVRVTTTNDDLPIVRLTSRENGAGFGAELISSDDLAPWSVRFETGPKHAVAGPLTIAEDLAVQPFELTLALPASWPVEVSAAATATILQRFILRYRGHQAYAQHI